MRIWMALTVLGISLLGKSSSRGKQPKVQERAWPEADPPAEGVRFESMNTNGTMYKKSEVRPGYWEWVEDTEAMKQIAHDEQHRRELFWALRTRVLTSEEMKEVERYGKYINIEPNTPYFQKDKDEELNSALLQQFKLRLACGKNH